MSGKVGKSYYADYGWKFGAVSVRPEYRYIVDWVDAGSKVLDVGCGDGSLGSLLIGKGCEVWGVDVSSSGVASANMRGVHADVGDVDTGLDFDDNFFDFVVINVTLQMVYRPGFVLQEALRVGRCVIVSFPNFAHIVSRLELLLLGRFPRLPLYGYRWYDTRHIHLFSHRDFVNYVAECGGVVRRGVFFGWDSESESFLARFLPNFFSRECILLVEKR